VRIEFFYFSRYWGMSVPKQRAVRRSRLDVCEQIMYHLLVFKPPMTESDVRIVDVDLYLPPELDERRAAALRSRS
jgi:hypothetical protein